MVVARTHHEAVRSGRHCCKEICPPGVAPIGREYARCAPSAPPGRTGGRPGRGSGLAYDPTGDPDDAGALSGPARAYALLTSYLIAQQHVSNRVLRDNGYHYTFLPWHGLRFYLDGWSQFDGVKYERIA